MARFGSLLPHGEGGGGGGAAAAAGGTRNDGGGGRRRKPVGEICSFLALVLIVGQFQPVQGFAFPKTPTTGWTTKPPVTQQMIPSSWFGISTGSSGSSTSPSSRSSTLELNAKKKKGGGVANAKLAALEALEALEEQTADGEDNVLDQPLSKKEQKALQKQQQKEQKAAAAATATTATESAKPKDAKAAALAALDALDDDIMDQPLSKKEQKALLKKQQKKQNQQQPQAEPVVAETPAEEPPKKKLSKKEEALMRALEMEERDNAAAAAAGDTADDQPKLSKKELKALKKKEEKMAAKAAKKAAKKDEKQQELEEAGVAAVGATTEGVDVPGAGAGAGDATTAPPPPPPPKKLSLEDKIRKERPPPRIRVMESSQPGYTSLRLENVGITFRNQEVLKDVTWGVQTGDRIGLVGANGAGKTTQLRILANEMEPTTGDVVKSSQDLRVSMLRQEFIDELIKDRTLKEEFMSVFQEEQDILNELRESEQALENMDTTSEENANAMQEILDRMQELQAKAEAKSVYSLESKVQKVMDVMGFTEDEGDDLVASFSGGWKMRIGLGKVLLKDPNVLLLDEPTNHLDLESVEWLESFLRQQNIPMVIVSHDREFLDQVCTKIVDAEGGICSEYDGNYSRFLQLKKARMDAWQASFDAQEKKIKSEKQWINKFKVKQPQAVKQRQAKLDKFLKSEEYVQKPPFFGKPFKFRFPDAPRLSPEVAEVKGLSHAYSNELATNRLFDEVDLFIEKGDRIAVLGPNGSGKSTLLRLLIGREDPDLGSAQLVGQNVVMNYFEQNQADALDLTKTVLETIQGASNGQSYNELRALLGQFLFKGDAVDKKVQNLSGGEKARLSLCCMMLRPANLLILDEPTNHLDIPAKEMLEEALQHFAGSVVIVSHDRYFISKVATTIVAIEEKKLTKYQGDYSFYMNKSKYIKEKVEARYVKGVDRIGSAPIVDLEELTKPKRNFGGAKNAGMVTRKNKGIKNAKRMQGT